jgi:uncharacterized Ntn-hydrolase superfamily protein
MNNSQTNYARLSIRPVATYSIVARDARTGEMGVAVQSHWFSVGPIVPWAEAGVGAVATQSFIDPSYGPLGLTLMAAGRNAPEALAALISTDEGEAVRQVAMVDTQGQAATHTGSKAIAAAGHYIGDGYSVQANMMENDTVWESMAKAYENAGGDLAERLLSALEAAENEGGDIRGKQSAAILVVSATSSGKPWEDRIFDLRVEDHTQPVPELRRLVQLKRAYRKLNEGDEWLAKKDMQGALAAYQAALAFATDQATGGEIPFWVGVTLVSIDQVSEALPYFQRAYRQDPHWADLILRLPAAELLPNKKPLLDKIIAAMQDAN